MPEKSPAPGSTQGGPRPARLEESLAPRIRPDFADFAKFFDHYLPRVLGYARRCTDGAEAAERLTEAILTEMVQVELGSGRSPLIPGPEADTALLRAARRVAARVR